MIEFPNHSRSYDRTRRAVHFGGYDSAIEASFFIEEDALRRLRPGCHVAPDLCQIGSGTSRLLGQA
ncbi:DUF1488 family protein [Bradyrhizobium yuanmingense]|uniref:DUF1488 family protein n=1 Tax=Bradyrhizobium yuanmingense TaxID=108015 RepID=UPI0009DA626A|nr:DUF1488 family protein [Bradyrhizobium yuanmingense]